MAKDKSLVSMLPKPQIFTVKMKLFNINGEYAEKAHTYEDVIYDVTDTKTVTKKKKEGYHETKLNIDGKKTDCLKRTVTRKMHAFPRNGRGQPLVPLGGVRGYIIGALVSISRDIGVNQGGMLRGILSWLRNGGVKITPYMVPVTAKDVTVADYWITEAKSKAFFEQLKEAEAEVTITVIPRDGFTAELVKELLKRAEGIGISPKRRGYWEIVEFN